MNIEHSTLNIECWWPRKKSGNGRQSDAPCAQRGHPGI